MIKIVREPSDTPNIQNTDDFVGLRYSYGDYNGYVNNKGQMLAYQINVSTFKVLSGRAVVNGVEVDIDANGASITIDNISQTQAHSLYIRVNLATMKADLFDVIGNDLPTSDDLTANTTGMAYLLLYTFSSTAGVISNVVKKVERVIGLKEVVSGITPVAKAAQADNSTAADLAEDSKKTQTTDFTNGEWQSGKMYTKNLVRGATYQVHADFDEDVDPQTGPIFKEHVMLNGTFILKRIEDYGESEYIDCFSPHVIYSKNKIVFYRLGIVVDTTNGDYFALQAIYYDIKAGTLTRVKYPGSGTWRRIR